MDAHASKPVHQRYVEYDVMQLHGAILRDKSRFLSPVRPTPPPQAVTTPVLMAHASRFSSVSSRLSSVHCVSWDARASVVWLGDVGVAVGGEFGLKRGSALRPKSSWRRIPSSRLRIGGSPADGWNPAEDCSGTSFLIATMTPIRTRVTTKHRTRPYILVRIGRDVGFPPPGEVC